MHYWLFIAYLGLYHMKRVVLFFALCLITWPLSLFSQQKKDTVDALQRILKNLETYQKNYPRERVYLQTDRAYYQAGDDIWFKAYITVSQFNFLSAISKIMYVELLNKQQEVIQSRRLPVISGLSVGDFTLPEALSAGQYHIRAYTNWMRNFDEAFFFHKTIRVGETPPKEKKPIALYLYPEGGSLISDIPTKLGFQAMQAEIPYPVKGYLESDGQKLFNFASDSTGAGHFFLTPKAGKTYTAVILLDEGNTIRTPLPKVETEGLHLEVNNLSDENVQVQVNTQTSTTKGQTLSLIAQSQGTVFYAAKHQLTKPQFTFRIPKDKLPSGVIQLALLDEGMHLLAERALFISHAEDRLSLSIQTDKQVYRPREKVDVQFRLQSQHDSTSVGAFSATVVNLSKIPKGQDNIFSTFWLNTNTYQSPLFQTAPAQLTPQQIDNKMRCIPPNRTFWRNIRDGQFPENAYKPEKELKISGTITSPEGKPLAQAKVTLVSLQNATAVLDTTTNASGRFSFDKILFYNQPEFVVQARDAKGRKNVKIVLDDSPNQQLAEAKNASEVKIKPSESKDSTDQSRNSRSLEEVQQEGFDGRSIVLEEVKITDKKENPAKYSSNLNGPGNADQMISGDELFMSSCPSLDMCLQGRLTGVIFRGGVPYSTRSPNRPMQIILDGMYMDPSSLNMINPFDVASIEVLRTIGNTAIYGMYGNGGVLIITTRRGDQPQPTDNHLYSSGITTFSPQGFYAIRHFQAPDYSKAPQEKENDKRTTIDWQPDIIANPQNPGHFSFYTADEPGVYRITVEGLDVDGHLAHHETYIRVE